MSYYFLYQKKGVPSWLAYGFILLLTIGLSLGLKGQSTPIISRADKKLLPTQITVSNITNETATLHFTTKDLAKTQIKLLTPDNQSWLKFDLRDQHKQTDKQLHYFQLDRLKANTQYQIQIYVDGKLFDKQIKFTTLNYQHPRLSNSPIFGKVVKSNLTAAENTLVELKIFPKSKVIYSTLTKQTGEWIITLPFVLDENQQEVEVHPEQPLTLKFTGPEFKQSVVRVKYKDVQPLRSIVLGQNYDFTKNDLVLGIRESQKKQLITAPTNNSALDKSFPTFRGHASKNSLVKVIIEPNIANLLISTDQNGNWQYIPLLPLPIGQYRLTAKQAGQEESITFQITKSGESVLGEATPSADLTVTPTPIQIITSVPSPTIELITPTEVAITPTITQEQIPSLGTGNNLLILLASSLSLLGLFFVLY